MNDLEGGGGRRRGDMGKSGIGGNEEERGEIMEGGGKGGRREKRREGKGRGRRKKYLIKELKIINIFSSNTHYKRSRSLSIID